LPDPAVVGVLGPLVGLVGAFEALLALRVLSGRGRELAGRLIVVDAERGEARTVALTPDALCLTCGRRDYGRGERS
jgi:adenylyltransferase/sulfurtransferase